MLPGVGPKSANKLWKQFSGDAAPSPAAKAATRKDEPVAGDANEKAAEVGKCNPLATQLQRCAGVVPKKANAAWAQFVATISQLEDPDTRGKPFEMLRLVIEAGYGDYLKSAYANYRSRLEDVQQLAAFARDFSTVEDFLAQLALLTNVEADDQRPAERKGDEQLRLSTIHQAKGLEFDVVFVIMLCEGLFPNARSMETEEGLEEERRLMYVAITRARNELYLSYPIFRAGYSPAGSGMQRASRFIDEIPRDLVEEYHLKGFSVY